VCDRCTVTEKCLAYAMSDMDTTGIWGGTTAQQRRAMRTGQVA
jgi:WhiB family redox-sensing transcriptional regulator